MSENREDERAAEASASETPGTPQRGEGPPVPADDGEFGRDISGVFAVVANALEGLDVDDEDEDEDALETAPTVEAAVQPTAPAGFAPIGPHLSAEEQARPMRFIDRELWSDFGFRLSVLIAAALIFFPGIGGFGLWDPWEVHYGAVSWGFMERGDWISPWWGSYWTAPEKSMEGAYFFSKPVLLLWLMGIGMEIFGFTETGIRVGVALIAVIGVWSVFLMGASIWSRRVGALMALTLATSPFYTMLGRQSQTDMPFVGLMTAGLAFFMMGVFGKHRDRKADKLSWLLFTAFVLAVTIPQLATITVGQLDWRGDLHWPEALSCYGPAQAALYGLCLFIVFFTAWRSPHTSRGQVHLLTFYAFVGLATMGKGILGFALPGAIIFVYLLISREWRMLARAEIPRGALLAFAVGFPWYGAMFARHGGIGGAFWDRFIIHDHFKRLATGVHQIDTGSFEHFIKWLGYGLFPWGSLVPGVFARVLGGDAGGERSDGDRARIFIFVWFGIAFSLFTLSSTKFHHYIFPAVPALALMAALVIDDLLEGKLPFRVWWPMWLGAAVIFALVGFDLIADPQHLKNLFTYKYDRRWDTDAWNADFQLALKCFVALGAVGLLAMVSPARKWLVRVGVGVFGLTAVLFAYWNLNVYMPGISSTWSQHSLWDTYYEVCTPVEPPRGAHRLKHDRYCLEPAISYKLNWRGETFYTMNEVIPVRDDDEWNYFIESNDGRCFYAIMERARLATFRNVVPADQRDAVREVHLIDPYDGPSDPSWPYGVEGDPVPDPDAPPRSIWQRLTRVGDPGADNIKFALAAVNCPLPADATADAAVEGSGEGSGDTAGP